MAKNTKDSAFEWSKFLKEKVVIAVWIDLCNGVSRHDIMQKLENDLMVEGVETSRLTKSMKYKIISDAYAMAKEELEEQRDKQRELFYQRLLTVFNESMEANDRQSALKSLDMFARFGGLYDKEKVEISGNLTETVNISFGFTEEKE